MRKPNALLRDADGQIHVRQLCFFLAFLSPVSKLLQAPAMLAYYAKGDLLLPAFIQYLLQGAMIFGLLFFSAKTQKSVFELLREKVGVWAEKTALTVFSVYFVFFSLLPLLEMERFVYTAFFDTAPSPYSFIPFFFLSAYVCTKSLQAFARCCDIALPFFVLSFLGLTAMSVGSADFSLLMPLFELPPKAVGLSVLRSFLHFSDTSLLLPMLGAYRYKKGDGKKIALAFSGGAFAVFVFLAIFYGTFGPLAVLKPYAFDKIAVYFSALEVVGRVDLLLVYMLTVLLLFYYCLPLQLCTRCFSDALGCKSKLPVAVGLNVGLFLLVVFFNRFYSAIYAVLTTKLIWIFPLFSYLIPLSCLLLIPKNGASVKKKEKKEQAYAQ
ncbi:MAG: GerAB/ArcD/ProY family transporter [Clostridia bacterium]|nr:GerAB/ArcD/ProY family transporter [Clostridia bacterium]